MSILIPCYNAESWISQAIESSLKQDWPNCEIWVIDDGSTDNSKALIEKYADRIRCEFTQNSGSNRTRNSLIERSTGEWIQFLDADDFLRSTKITKDLHAASSNTDMILSPVETWHEADGEYGKTVFSAEEDLFEQWLAWEFPQTAGILWRADFLRAIGGWNEEWKNCQDFELSYRAIINKARFVMHDTPGAVYRILDKSTVSRKNVLSTLENRLRLMIMMVSYLSERSSPESLNLHKIGCTLGGMCRTYAGIDLEASIGFYERCNQLNKVIFSPQTAPQSYRFFEKIFGFYFAEYIAKKFRK